MKILLFVWLICQGLYADPCDGLLAELGFNRPESEYLSAFNPANMKPGGEVDLSKSVFQVFAGQEPSFVIRFQTGNQDIGSEAFSSAFTRQGPGTLTPQIRKLTEKETASAFQHLSSKNRTTLLAKNHGEIPKAASVAVHFPMDSGEAFNDLIGFHYADNLYSDLIDLTVSRLDRRERDSRIEQFWRIWDRAPEKRRKQLYKDIRSMGGPFKGMTYENFKNQFSRYLHVGNLLQMQGIVERALNLIPSAKMEPLANLWVLSAALGQKDFHAGNWLFLADYVMQIDLAHRRSNKTSGANPYSNSRFPILEITPSKMPVINAWIRRASPKAIDYLRSISKEGLKELARKSEYPISDDELEAILWRRDDIVRRYQRLTRAP